MLIFIFFAFSFLFPSLPLRVSASCSGSVSFDCEKYSDWNEEPRGLLSSVWSSALFILQRGNTFLGTLIECLLCTWYYALGAKRPSSSIWSLPYNVYSQHGLLVVLCVPFVWPHCRGLCIMKDSRRRIFFPVSFSAASEASGLVDGRR